VRGGGSSASSMQGAARLVLTRDRLRTRADPRASHEEGTKGQIVLHANRIFREFSF